MNTLASIGVRIRVTPWDEIYVKMSEQDPGNYINDPTPFEFRVEGRLEDGQIFYGLYGPVVSGPERYHNLICNIFVRVDGSDWRISSKCSANFKGERGSSGHRGRPRKRGCHHHRFAGFTVVKGTKMGQNTRITEDLHGSANRIWSGQPARRPTDLAGAEAGSKHSW